MSLNELCAICEAAPAVRLLGTVAHCSPCVEAFLGPLRAKHGQVTTQGRSEHGGWWLKCICGASWVGGQYDPCPWCRDRYDRATETDRANLLSPSWLSKSEGNATYDSLSPVDQEVWDRTRGQYRGVHSYAAWLVRLGLALRSGLITESEARNAIRRFPQ